MEEELEQKNLLLEDLVAAQAIAHEIRYEAEIAYEEKYHTRVNEWMDKGFTATHARSRAKVESIPQLREWLAAKRQYHMLEERSRATQLRIMTLMNMNRGLVVQYGSYR